MSGSIPRGRTLALETSSTRPGVALVEQGRVVAEAQGARGEAPTERLLLGARDLLAGAGWRAADLARVAYSEGPGSFTGLRVGMACALGVAIGAGVPLVAVGTLEVLAYPWKAHPGPIAVLSGLRRGMVYAALYRWTAERFEPLIDPASIPLAEAPARLLGSPGDRFLFVGDALDSLPREFDSWISERGERVEAVPPRAADVGLLAEDPARPAWKGREQEGRTPLYLRDADARRPAGRP